MKKKVDGSQILEDYQLKINSGWQPVTNYSKKLKLYCFTLTKLILYLRPVY